MNFLRSLLVFLALFLFGASFANAASLYLDPPSGVYGVGSTFSVKVRVDTQEECINALNVTLLYPNTIIKAVDVARGESILTLWTEEPKIDHENGTIKFSGGLPGGYCGRIEGDPGFTNVIAEIIFQVPGLTVGNEDTISEGSLVFGADTEILLNDGFGTKAQLFVNDASFSIEPAGVEGTSDKWFDVVRNDKIQPEPFSIELLRNPSVYGGKWFIVFSALDKQSGMDRYEIYETDIDREGYIRRTKKDEVSLWKIGTSPYLIEDQTLNSVIRVRAIDKAGNIRLAGRIPEESIRTKTKAPINKNLFYVGGSIVFIILIFFIFHFIRKRKLKSRDIMESNNKKVDSNSQQESNKDEVEM